MKYFAGKLFSKFHQNKLRNTRARHDLIIMLKIFGVNFQNKKLRDGPLVLKSDQFYFLIERKIPFTPFINILILFLERVNASTTYTHTIQKLPFISSVTKRRDNAKHSKNR